MGMTLKLTQNVLNTYVGRKAQVLHDLHESVAVPVRQHRSATARTTPGSTRS